MNHHAVGFRYAFPRPATACGPADFGTEGIDTYTLLLAHALGGALSTGTTPVIAAQMAHEATEEALKLVLLHELGPAPAPQEEK